MLGRLSRGLKRGAVLTLTLMATGTATESLQISTPPPPTFKSGIESVELDVAVTNSKGVFVRDLTRNDFRVSEDGKPQAVTTFALVDLPVDRRDEQADAPAPLESDVTTNEHPVEGRIYVLVLDDLHTAPLAVPRTQAAAKQFIARLGANDLMAVVHTAGADSASQSFTSDKARLTAAVDKMIGSDLESATAERNQNVDATFSIITNDLDELQRAAQAQTTLHMVRDVSNWFAAIRGRRKAILLMSAGLDYPMTDVDSSSAQNRPWDEVLHAAREATDAAARSNVSIYGIDPGGLSGPDDISVNYQYGAGNRAAGPRAASADLRMQQDSLRWLSEQTGGIAVVGRNDLAKAYDEIVADNSSYYVLSYDPPNHKRDGKFHKIAVRVDRPGLTIRSRNGYLSPIGNASETPIDPVGPSRALRSALASPLPVSGLTMRVSFTPFRGAPPNASVLLTEDLRGSDLKLGTPGTLELSYVAADASGKLRAASNDRLQLMTLRPETKLRIERSGLRVFNRVALPPGRYTLRVAIRDQAGGALGSVPYDLDVPDFHTSPFSMSGLVVTSISTGRMVVAKEDAQMKDVLPAPPIAERSFPQNDQVWVYAEVYDNAGNTPHSVNIATTLTSASGAVVYKVDEDHASSAVGDPRATYKYRARVPLSDVVPGAYVLAIEARARLGREETVSHRLPITVTATTK